MRRLYLFLLLLIVAMAGGATRLTPALPYVELTKLNHFGFAWDEKQYQYLFGQNLILSRDGNTAAISSRGSWGQELVHVFSRKNDGWRVQMTFFGQYFEYSPWWGYPSLPLPNNFGLSGDGNTLVMTGLSEYNGIGYTAVYFYTRSGETWTLHQTITGAGDKPMPYGNNIAISDDGSTVLIASPYIPGYVTSVPPASSAIFVFTRNNGLWTQQHLITSDGERIGDAVSLSPDGNSAVIGNVNRRTAYLFKRNNGVWTEQAKITQPDSNLFGFMTDLSSTGDTVIVGIPAYDDYKGSVHIFTAQDNGWSQQLILPPDPSIWFGNNLELSDDGNTAIINGGYGAYLYRRSGDTWLYHQILPPPSGDHWWAAVSLNGAGTMALVGAPASLAGIPPQQDLDGQPAGEVYEFVDLSGTWTPQSVINAQSNLDNTFGADVALSADKNTLLVSSLGHHNFAGAVYVFSRINGLWMPQSSLAPDKESSLFGATIDLSDDGNIAIVSALESYAVNAVYIFIRNGDTWIKQPINNTDYVRNVVLSGNGEIALLNGRVFVNINGIWQQQTTLSPLDGEENAQFAYDVDISHDANLILAGAPGVQGTGAVYVFTRNGDTWTQRQRFTPLDAALADEFGKTVTLSSDSKTALITGKNSAYIFTLQDGLWSQQARLEDHQYSRVTWGDHTSLSHDGHVALIGESPEASGNQWQEGKAHLFTLNGSIWSYRGEITASDGTVRNWFGDALTLDNSGTMALIGAPRQPDSIFSEVGAVYEMQLFIPGVLISKTDAAITEAGSADSYTVSLSAPPQFDVNITLNFEPESEVQADQTVLTFNDGNWNLPQTINLSAVNDSEFEAIENVTIHHLVSSEDTGYDLMTVASVNVTVSSDDQATQTFTPEPPTLTATHDPSTSTFTPEPPTLTATSDPSTATFTAEAPTSTNTIEPPLETDTPIPPTVEPVSIELLLNPGFEERTFKPSQPDIWVGKGLAKDRLKCDTATVTFSNSGDCAFRFVGSAVENARLTQTVNNPAGLSEGVTLNTHLYYKTNNAKPKLKVKLKVFYSGVMLPDIIKTTISVTSTDYRLQELSPYPVKAGTVARVKIQFQNRALSGKIYLDDVSVNYTQ